MRRTSPDSSRIGVYDYNFSEKTITLKEKHSIRPRINSLR